MMLANCFTGRTFRCPGLALASVLVVAALGCSDETQSPTGPEATSQSAPALAVASAAALPFRQLSAGYGQSCGLTTSDRLYCWGVNSNAQLGNGSDTGPETCSSFEVACSTRPVAVAGGLRFRAATAGVNHTCAVTFEDKAYCWGENFSGGLGDGTTTKRTSPVPVVGGLRFRQLSAGSAHTCGLATDNRIYCWGSNSYGQVGDGTRDDRNTPVAVAGALQFRQVSAGYEFTCGLTTTDRVYCWGLNSYGQLGDGTEIESRAVPAPLAGDRAYRELDAGGYHACAITVGSRTFCWGYGRYGQLGSNTTYMKNFSPRRVASDLSFERITAGAYNTCGETTGNRAYCWGYNAQGQVGDGTTTQRLTPVAVAGGLFFAQVSTGGMHTCARTSDNVAYCWGRNLYGGLGDGTEGKRLKPTRVVGPA